MRVLLGLVCLATFFSAWASAATIRVGGYPFEPYVRKDARGYYQGVTLDLIRLLNSIQQQHVFVFVPTSSTNRYKALERGRFDVMFFEDPLWGWQEQSKVQTVDTSLSDKEIYVTLSGLHRDQRMFERLQDRHLALMDGYHYGFADFNADRDYLERHYRVSFVKSNYDSINMLMKKRAELAPVTYSYLIRLFRERPRLEPLLLLSVKVDQVYNLDLIVGEASEISAAELDQLIAQLKQSGSLQKLAQRYGLSFVN